MFIWHYYTASGFSLLCTAIGNAFAVLSDPEKRRRYDQFGDENPQPRIYRDHYDYARGFEGQWNILEISNISFLYTVCTYIYSVQMYNYKLQCISIGQVPVNYNQGSKKSVVWLLWTASFSCWASNFSFFFILTCPMGKGLGKLSVN